MSFEDMPAQEPYRMPTANNYARVIREGSRQAMASLRTALDLPYGDDYYQKVDIYLPDDTGARDLPVLMYLHGGGWEKGYKEEMGFMAPPIVSLPAVFVSVSYRLAPAVTNRDQLDDTIAAIAFVHSNIARYGGSPEKIIIGGHSAGGHLAALAALRKDKLAAAGLPEDVIKYCVPVSAPYEIDPKDDGHAPFFRTQAEAREASPIAYVPGTRMPFYISWARHDFDGCVRDGPPMVEALKAAGAPVDFDIFEDMDHFDISVSHGNATGRWAKKIRGIMAQL